MISTRHYMFALDGTLKRISDRVFGGLYHGSDAAPDYAGTRQRIATALVRLEDRKPAKILDVRGQFWTFDAMGRVDQDEQLEVLRELTERAYSSPTPKEAKIVSLTPAIRKREHDARHRWEPTKEDLDRIAADLWPGINGAAEDVATVKGTAPIKPPLTWQAEDALKEIASALFKVALKLDALSERALKGLAFEARRHTTVEDDKGLWAGVAEAADRRREILARHRTGKGVWYAVIEGYASDPNDRDTSTEVDVAFEQCQGKKAAIQAARRLLAENAHKFSETFTLEAFVKCDLEWAPILEV